jgi:Zn-dependent peptidase ImmA (M78 family)/transcriptional regulator with XRE-family HTH domain
MSVDGEKLRLVRLALGWQQTDMARLLRMKQPNLSEMEGGVRQVPEHVVATLTFLTGFSPTFFLEPVKADVPSGSDLWYRKAKNKYRKTEESQAYCQLVFDTFEPLTANLRARPTNLSRLKGCIPEEAAMHVRNALGVRPGAPLENVAHLVEAAGVRLVGIGSPLLRPNIISDEVAGLAKAVDPGNDFEAFSFWTKEGLPVIFVRTDIPNDRYNWAIVHETIHLTMHSSSDGNIRQAESEGQAGAKEAMLPSAALSDSFGAAHSVVRLASLASRWNVSLKSMVLRAAELGVLSEANKRYYLGAVNKGAGDSVQVRAQRPRFYRQMCELLFGKPIHLNDVARKTGASKNFLQDVLLAHSGRPEDLA